MRMAKRLIVLLSIALLLAVQPAISNDYDRARAAYQSGDYATVVRLVRPLAEEGDARAQTNLGRMYENGLGIQQDYTEAIKWYRKAAEQGEASAQTNLGWMYENSLGVQQNYEEAMKWYRRAAEQGEAYAQHNLGVMYADGRGVQRDYVEAIKWFRKAAEKGYARAQAELGHIYRRGNGVPRDHEEAEKWYRMAADQGLASAQRELDLLRSLGVGVPSVSEGTKDGIRSLLHIDFDSVDGRAVPVSVMRTVSGEEVRRFRHVFAPTWSPAGDEFAFVDHALRIVQADGAVRLVIERGELARFGETFYGLHPAWAPNGDRIATISQFYDPNSREYEWAISIFETEGGRLLFRHLIPDETAAGCPFCMAWPNKFRWSGDGYNILLSWGNTIVARLKTAETLIVSDAWSSAEWADNSSVYYFEVERMPPEPITGFYLWRLDTGKRRLLLDRVEIAKLGITPATLWHVPRLDSSPSRRQFVLNSGSHNAGSTLRFYDLTREEQLDLSKPDEVLSSEDVTYQLAWSPTGRLLATISGPRMDKTIRVMTYARTERKWTTLSTINLPTELPPEIFGYKLLSWAE